MLRDTQGIAQGHACIPPALIPIVARFTGEQTCAEIAREVSAEVGQPIPTALVERDWRRSSRTRLFLDGPSYRAALGAVRQQFHDATLRTASHAGGAYASRRGELSAYLDEKCLAKAVARTAPDPAPSGPRRTLTGLIAPHIDPWRGAVGYGHAYAALRDARWRTRSDTFVVFGTSHAPMRAAVRAVPARRSTPRSGALSADFEAIDRIAERCPYDPYVDELNHKREHSIEFQAVFLKHVLRRAARRASSPSSRGLGRQQARPVRPGGGPARRWPSSTRVARAGGGARGDGWS